MRKSLILAVGVLLLGSIVLVGCGGGNGNGGDDSSSETANVGVTTDDQAASYVMTATPGSVAAGSVKFEATNNGLLEHELLVLLITEPDVDAANLPVVDDALPEVEVGAVATIPGVGTIIGEIEPEDLQPGQTNDVTFDLQAGEYILMCNIETHYQLGMWTEFSVT